MNYKVSTIGLGVALCVACSQPGQVKVSGGVLQGVPSDKEGLSVFRGVRYAEAPV